MAIVCRPHGGARQAAPQPPSWWWSTIRGRNTHVQESPCEAPGDGGARRRGERTALTVTAAPAQAAGGFDCSVSVDAPWHSTSSNRVYFNGSVHCWGDLPDIIQLYNGGAGRSGNQERTTRKTCSHTFDCYSDGGVTYIPYQGYGQYCGIVDAYVSSYFNVIVNRHYAKKNCVWI